MLLTMEKMNPVKNSTRDTFSITNNCGRILEREKYDFEVLELQLCGALDKKKDTNKKYDIFVNQM